MRPSGIVVRDDGDPILSGNTVAFHAGTEGFGLLVLASAQVPLLMLLTTTFFFFFHTTLGN